MDSHENAAGELPVAPVFDDSEGLLEPPGESTPSLFYRSTARLNILVWKLPLPRRVLARLSRTIYRSPPMPADVTLGVLGVLQGADVRCWITGGWGVDALAGRASRTHHDLDLVVDDRDLQRAMSLLRDLGYREWFRSDDDEELLGSYVALQDNELAGRVIDVHPAQLPDSRLEFTTGLLEGHPVPCMSLAFQIDAHSGYKPRRHHRADLGVLRRLGG